MTERIVVRTAGYLVGVAMAAGLAAQTVNYTYDEAGRLTRVSYPNGATITYTYDTAGNLLSRQVTSAASSGAAGHPPRPKPKTKATAGKGSAKSK